MAFSMREGELSTAAIHRLIKKAGAERVGDDAVRELGKVVEDIALRISKEAIELASHAGRKTIKVEDIQLATKRIMRE
jgi:histone H3/H4